MRKTIFGLGILGVLFSGYLSAVKLFSNTCAFGETCPYFLGYPSCYYGFVMFLLIAIFGWRYANRKGQSRLNLNWLSGISFLGILFAGYFTLGELPALISDGLSAYILGLPTCALGLIFYVIVFILSIMAHSRE